MTTTTATASVTLTGSAPRSRGPVPELSEKELLDAKTRIQAGRALAIERHPYLDTALSSMVLVARPGLGTVATDRRWRMYYDPARVLGQDVNECVSDWLHEVGHLLRDHPSRWTAMGQAPRLHPLFNAAGDALINEDNADMGLVMLDTDVRFTSFPPEVGANRTMTTEEIFHALLAWAQQQSASCPTHGQPGSPSPDANGSDPSDSGGQDSPGQGGAGDGDPSGTQPGSGACTCPLGGLGSDCGSGAGGGAREWEEDLTDNAGDGSVDAGRADLVQQETAHKVADAARKNGRGTVPAGLLRWANDLLAPAVNWRTELRSIVSRTLGQIAGRRDYTYSRPSRRTIPRFLLPGMAAHVPPSVAVIIDTSGSMGEDDLSQCLADVSGLLRAASGSAQPLKVITCDAAAHTAQTVRTVRNITLAGGGGTDMRVGIAAAAALRPKPQVIITLTDGETPWPDAPPEDNPFATYIAVLVRGDCAYSQVPDWMHRIVVDPRTDTPS